MKKFLRENGLSISLIVLFVLTIVGQMATGLRAYNDEARLYNEPQLGLLEYLQSGAFVEAVFENWESEFLQMALFVMLTKHLMQKGSSESKSFDGTDEVDEDPRKAKNKKDAPWPVRKGGWVLSLYERSLSIAFLMLFFVSFAAHAYGGMRLYNHEQVRHGEPTLGVFSFMGTSDFWEESFQNWQSEFLSVAVLVLLSIVLRERYSPQSKPVADPHSKTGG